MNSIDFETLAEDERRELRRSPAAQRVSDEINRISVQ